MSQELLILSKIYALEKLMEELVPDAKTFLEEKSQLEMQRLKEQEAIHQQKMFEIVEERLGMSSKRQEENKQNFDWGAD